MAHTFDHLPVLRDEVVSLFASVPPGPVVDATVGGGGHAAAILETYPALRVVGLDRDPVALEAARERLAPFGDRVTLIRSPFSALQDVVSSSGPGPGPGPDSDSGPGPGSAPGGGLGLGPLSGVLLDLGVSSPQLDRAERGFSFRSDGPLDMRMDPSDGVTAAELVNGLPEDALAALFRENGEGRLSGRIARAIVAARPLSSTRELAEVVASAVPAAARRKGHPARRVFQALRIEVNDEMGQLRSALPAALSHLAVGGVCAVISYHSGEDRLTKQTFAEAESGGCVCPPGLPCVCGAVSRHRLVFRGARKPSPSEIAANPRAESARLRAIVRTEEG
jgi:16S rRNA (cytosine1402-N4)-methyltransferase